MRIRSIKPEFWRSDDIDALSIEDRLLFIGLWSYVDDSGVGVDKEAAIAADLFAGDLARDAQECSVRVHGGLKRLEEAGLIARYDAAGRRFLHVTNWDRHQKINRPSESRYPHPTSINAPDHGGLTEGSVSPQEDSPFGTGEQGNRGTVNCADADAPALPDMPTPPKTGKPARVDFVGEFARFWALYPLRRDRAKAFEAFKTARKAGASLEAMCAGAAKYRDEVRGRDKAMIKYGQGWISGKRWEDYEQESVSVDAVREDAVEWVRGEWRAGRVRPIEGRAGLRYSMPDLPLDVNGKDEIEAFYVRAAQEWITANHDEIVRRLTVRAVA